jgi:hypothetical protein
MKTRGRTLIENRDGMMVVVAVVVVVMVVMVIVAVIAAMAMIMVMMMGIMIGSGITSMADSRRSNMVIASNGGRRKRSINKQWGPSEAKH